MGVKIKDATLIDTMLIGTESVPVSDGSNLPKRVEITNLRGFSQDGTRFIFEHNGNKYCISGIQQLITPAKPVISTPGSSGTGYDGTLNGSGTVSITCETTEVTTYYNIVDADPKTTHSSGTSISLTQDNNNEYIDYKCRAICVKNGVYSDEADSVIIRVYRKLSTPTISPDGSIYSASRTITISQSYANTIQYKIGSGEYQTGTSVTRTSDSVITAKCSATGWLDSGETSETILVGKPRMWYGFVDSAPFSISDITAANGFVEISQNTDTAVRSSFSFTTAAGSGSKKLCIVYGIDYADLTSIKDNNGTENLSDALVAKSNLDSTYKMYIFRASVDQTGLSYTIKNN